MNIFFFSFLSKLVWGSRAAQNKKRACPVLQLTPKRSALARARLLFPHSPLVFVSDFAPFLSPCVLVIPVAGLALWYGECNNFTWLSSAFYDFVQMYVHHLQMRVQTRRLAHGPFQLAVH